MAGRVDIAFTDDAMEPSPTWTTIDATARVAGIDIRRGRQTEFDVTETSTATVYVNDTDGLFDPGNPSSPYYGQVAGRQIRLSVRNPVTGSWVQQWRGFIDDIVFDFNPATNPDGSLIVANVAFDCVDAFDYLAGVEMLPGIFGDPGGPDGVVFYDDTDVQTRIENLLGNAGWPSALSAIFTGNVDVQESRYDPGDAILPAIRDAADAEFPGVANVYVDKRGYVVFHGRYARFTPETVAGTGDWTFTRWKAGDGTAILLDDDRAQIRAPLRWSHSRNRIINAALAYPRFMKTDYGGGTFGEADIPGQIARDLTSIGLFGYRSWSATDLITLAGFVTGNDAKGETKLYATYYKANYSSARTRVDALAFKSIAPDDPRATATWALITGFDISDIVNLEHGYPGGVGISEDFYIEGSEMSIRPLNPDYDMVELTLNVSPAAYYPPDYLFS